MASIFKRKRKRPIPDGAQIVKTKTGKAAKWTDGRGRSRRESLSDDGKSILVEDRKWSIMYTTASGKRKLKTGAPTYEATVSLAKKLESDQLLYKHGVRDRSQEKAAAELALPLSKHLGDFEAKMAAEHRAEKHIASTIAQIERLCEARDISTIGCITADKINQHAQTLKAQGKSQRTIHASLTAMKSFTRWLVQHGKLAGDPLASVKKPNPNGKRKLRRRMLLPDEFHRLQVAARKSGERYGMAGDERALLYDFAIQTGLRHDEIRRLKVTNLHLDGQSPHVRLGADETKNRKPCKQYLMLHTAKALRDHVARKMPGAGVFSLPDPKRVPAMLREDVEAARLAWLKEATKRPNEYRKREQSDFLLAENYAGETLDFHALRHTCGAWASKAGAQPKAVQTLMRHSSIVLTMDTYGHLFPDEAAATVQLLAMFHPEAKAG